jgi:PBP1b-binding outer membrane lipoprotein LpoB
MKTITKLIYLLTSALSILALMLVSCSSGTTASTTRQTTTTAATTADHGLPSQPTGYQDIGAGGAHLGGPGNGW